MTEESGDLARADGETLAWRRLEGAGPTVIWLGGYRSDMAGTKAESLAAWSAAAGRSYLRYDHFGHGRSSGRFCDATITRWRDDALAVIDTLTAGLVILVGSSMGGWIACLAALARPERLAGLVLIAPAADFVDKLIEPNLHPAAREALQQEGVWIEPSPYDAEGTPFYRALLEDGPRWSILPGPVEIAASVRVLQGMQDDAVPWRHAAELFHAITAPDARLTLVRDGDHRLSRPQDLKLLTEAIESIPA